MKKAASFFIILISFQISLIAQVYVTGTIKDSLNMPVPFVSVYLSNTTIGTVADSKGLYKLYIPQKGVYELTASCIGFKFYSKKIEVNDKNLVVDFSLRSNNIILKDIVVTSKDNNRKKNYAIFLKQFVGETANAAKCKINNPEDIRLHFDSEKNRLTGYSIRPVEIENYALGFKIFYDLSAFEYDFHTQSVMYMGKSLFKEMDVSVEEKEKLKIERKKNYLDSKLHFIRAIYAGSLKEEKFEVFDYDSVSETKTIIRASNMLKDDLKPLNSPDYKTFYYPKK